MAIYKHRETGMVKALLREDDDSVTIADLGNEAGAYRVDRDEFENDFEEVPFSDFQPATSGHSADAHRGAEYAKASEEDLKDEGVLDDGFDPDEEGENSAPDFPPPAPSGDSTESTPDGDVTTLTGDLGAGNTSGDLSGNPDGTSTEPSTETPQ